MEHAKMSESFANICGKAFGNSMNGERYMNLISTEVTVSAGGRQTVSDRTAPAFMSIVIPTAREAFISIVTASSCANAKGEEILKSCTTLIRQSTFLRSYMY